MQVLDVFSADPREQHWSEAKELQYEALCQSRAGGALHLFKGFPQRQLPDFVVKTLRSWDDMEELGRHGGHARRTALGPVGRLDRGCKRNEGEVHPKGGGGQCGVFQQTARLGGNKAWVYPL